MLVGVFLIFSTLLIVKWSHTFFPVFWRTVNNLEYKNLRVLFMFSMSKWSFGFLSITLFQPFLQFSSFSLKMDFPRSWTLWTLPDASPDSFWRSPNIWERTQSGPSPWTERKVSFEDNRWIDCIKTWQLILELSIERKNRMNREATLECFFKVWKES